MIKRSAGLLVFRTVNEVVEVFLVHPGGPFYVKKDLGVWSIPKGEFEAEEPFAAARREFQEETGFPVAGDFIEHTGREMAAAPTASRTTPSAKRCHPS